MYTHSKSKLTKLVPPSPSVTPVPEMSQLHIPPKLLPTLSEDEDNTPKSPQVSLAEENPTSSSFSIPASSSGSKPLVPAHQVSKPKIFKPSAAPRVDLMGKLDSQGKLTQQERQRRIDKNLCMFCGGTGHRTDTCPVKAASAKARTATASALTSTPPQPKTSGTEKKKD